MADQEPVKEHCIIVGLYPEAEVVFDRFGKSWVRTAGVCKPGEIVMKQARLNPAMSDFRKIGETDIIDVPYRILKAANRKELKRAMNKHRTEQPWTLKPGGEWYEFITD